MQKQKYKLHKNEIAEIELPKSGRWELSKKILATIGTGAVLLTLLVAPGTAKLLKLFDMERAGFRERQKKKERIMRAVKRLKKNRLVAMHEKDEELFIELTASGKKRLLHYQLENLVLRKPSKWDGKWRIVIFDIPEKHKKAREALRHNLHRLSFYPLQRSVFAYPYPCKDEIDFVSEFFAIGYFVNYFEANYFDDDSKLKLHFQELLD